MSDRKIDIQDSYKELGGTFANFYEQILTYSSPLGKMMNKLMWGFNEETTATWINEALAGIPDDFSGELLEVPVGTGILTMPIYKYLPHAEITCLDYSKEMMDHARQKAVNMNWNNVNFCQGDVGQLPFPDETFDVVLSLNGFHAFPDKEAAYHETYRVLKKGGTFCGCFYISGEKKRTDWFCRHVLVPKKSFTPPFETKESLHLRLANLYAEAKVQTLNAEGIFCCKK